MGDCDPVCQAVFWIWPTACFSKAWCRWTLVCSISGIILMGKICPSTTVSTTNLSWTSRQPGPVTFFSVSSVSKADETWEPSERRCSEGSMQVRFSPYLSAHGICIIKWLILLKEITLYSKQHTKCSLWQMQVLATGHTVAQLVEALHYKLEGRRFDPQWCHWHFSFT